MTAVSRGDDRDAAQVTCIDPLATVEAVRLL